MSQKNLLEEGTIRRFMKLAGNSVLASDFLAEDGKAGKMDRQDIANKASGRWLKEEEELEEGEEIVTEQEEDLEALGAPEAEEADMGMDLDMAAEEPPLDEPEEESSVEEFARDVLDAIQDVASEHGIDMEVEEMEPEDIDVGDMDMDMDPEEEDLEAPGGAPPEASPEEPEELEEINYVDEEALLERVYDRVSNRLRREKKIDKMAATLAENISRKLDK